MNTFLGRGVLFAEVFAAVFARDEGLAAFMGKGFAAFFAAPAFLVVKFFAVAFARVEYRLLKVAGQSL